VVRAATMLKHVVLAFLLAWQVEPFYTIEDYGGGPCKVSCQREAIPPGFTCAFVFNLDPPLPDGISRIVGGNYAVIRGVALILNGTLYTAVFDPPLEQNDRFPSLSRDQGIPARVEGNHLFVRLPNGKEAKAMITRHESLHPNQPQSV
jgi:hypothetical protein